jgi:hypothetical protein
VFKKTSGGLEKKNNQSAVGYVDAKKAKRDFDTSLKKR